MRRRWAAPTRQAQGPPPINHGGYERSLLRLASARIRTFARPWLNPRTPARTPRGTSRAISRTPTPRHRQVIVKPSPSARFDRPPVNIHVASHPMTAPRRPILGPSGHRPKARSQGWLSRPRPLIGHRNRIPCACDPPTDDRSAFPWSCEAVAQPWAGPNPKPK